MLLFVKESNPREAEMKRKGAREGRKKDKYKEGH